MVHAVTILGLDIGGANLKAACSPGGEAVSRAFTLWKDPKGLEAAIGDLIGELPQAEILALTMTGELCDCWADKCEGVVAIVDAVVAVASSRPVWIWTNRGDFVEPDKAREDYQSVASANWLATATLAGRYAADGLALLVDIGTTTTDIVPLRDGVPTPQGRTDPARLACGELVYRGWRRTPVCALGGLELAAELFATMQDIFLVLGRITDSPEDLATADGRPATQEAARARLARMYCLDPRTIGGKEVIAKAKDLEDRFCRQIAGEINRVADGLAEVRAVLGVGSGEFLLSEVLARSDLAKVKVVSLAGLWGGAGSEAAAALAVAELARGM